MDQIKISKQKHIQFCLLTMTSCFLIIATIVLFLLTLGASDFGTKYVIFYSCVFVGDIVVPLCIFVILRVVNKSFYIITAENIKLFKATQEVFTIPVKAIGNLNYIDFKYAFKMQMGAGYLSFPFSEAYGKIKPTMTFPSGDMLFAIDMNAKQAQQVAHILGKELS